MNQAWFEFQQIRKRTFQRSVWIPLRAVHTREKVGQYGYVGFKSEFFGVGSLAVPVEQKTNAEELGWTDIGISHDHCGYFQEDEYIPSNVYKAYNSEIIGEHLVLEQRGNRKENVEWHLNQDFVITLGLRREGHVWVRPDERYVEIAKLSCQEDGSPCLLEIRASHLRDYLCARKMALYITSYRDRVEIVENADHITWTERSVTEKNEKDIWEGRISEIHEGGMPFGEKIVAIHVARTDVDEEEDVPTFDFPTDDAVKSESRTRKYHGRKLFRIQGEFWRNEWIDPALISPIVRGDETPPTVHFITDAEGTQENKKTLVGSSRWLWFRPEVVIALAHRRGGSLGWYTRDTGCVGCSPDYTVHFGVNKLGLVNVYAKDIGLLPDWQQKIWAGDNVSPDGKVSEELLASQMRAEPAATRAPEEFLAEGFKRLNILAERELGITLLRDHDSIPELIEKAHRFRAIDKAGLYALAKDVARLTAERINTAAIQAKVPPPKGEEWGSLKSLEKLIATKTDPKIARSMLSSLVGIYELRHGDAHLPSGKVDNAFDLIGIDQSLPYVHQGYQLLHSCVSNLYLIADAIENWNA